MRLDCRRTQRKILCTLHDGRRKFFEVDGVIDFEGNFSENFSGGIDDFDFIFVGNKKILIPKREVLERFIGADRENFYIGKIFLEGGRYGIYLEKCPLNKNFCESIRIGMEYDYRKAEEKLRNMKFGENI